jgi:signal transduction histidine kinase
MTRTTNAIESGDPGIALQDCAPTGVIAVDGDGRVVAVNPHAQQTLKISAATTVGQPASQLPVPLGHWIEEALEAAGPSNPLLSRANAKFSAQLTVSYTAEGHAAGLLVEFQDLGLARSIAANLEHLDRLAGLGVLTAGVAHEIKNALVAVRTFFDLAGLGETDPELRNVAAGEIQRIEKTVRQLLRGAKREQFRLAPLSVHALVQDAVNLLRHELQTREIQLVTTFSASTDRINGDERQLRHALVNVLLNAIEAINSSGKLTIYTEVVDAWERQHLRVSVKDSGPGISADVLDRLFNPFFTTKVDGTGLGLLISQRIFQGHNGTITVESELGNGATFHLFLPLL